MDRGLRWQTKRYWPECQTEACQLERGVEFAVEGRRRTIPVGPVLRHKARCVLTGRRPVRDHNDNGAVGLDHRTEAGVAGIRLSVETAWHHNPPARVPRHL
jgi:hypothetical protein